MDFQELFVRVSEEAEYAEEPVALSSEEHSSILTEMAYLQSVDSPTAYQKKEWKALFLILAYAGREDAVDSSRLSPVWQECFRQICAELYGE